MPPLPAPEPNPIQQLNAVINQVHSQGLAHQLDGSRTHVGRTVEIAGRELINFGSCGYMGLEFDPRVHESAIDATRKFGIVFPCSRAFISSPLYPALEERLEKIFCRPTLLGPTTTLMHLGALPVLVGREDMVFLDQQVHSSVQLAAKVLKANGTEVEIVPHNNLVRLERKINAWKGVKEKIWYLGDGVYSMYGDRAPVQELKQLLDIHEQFHVYLDDAHGMSWTGERGRGYVLNQLSDHERLFVVAGLGKGFGTGGSALTCPTIEAKQLVRNCSGTQIFSTPLQPPLLGAAMASAEIHLSPEFPALQQELQERIEFCNHALEGLPVPVISAPETPIRFIGIGSTEKAQSVVKEIIHQGFWLNIAQFPAVAPQHAGLRFMLTRMQSKEGTKGFIQAMRHAIEKVIGRDEKDLEQIWNSFRKDYRYSLIQG